MDYKMWILLMAILLLILYIIKEVYFIKFDLLSYINTLKNNHEENNLIIRKNFQNDLNVFANKIKLLNDENLQQFRKITLLNTQPIVKNNNYFKEMIYTESDNESELKYLSDSKMPSNYMGVKQDIDNEQIISEKLDNEAINNNKEMSSASVIDVNNTPVVVNTLEKLAEEDILKTSSEKESDIIKDNGVSLNKEITVESNNNQSISQYSSKSTEKVSNSAEEISFEKQELEKPQNNLFMLGYNQEQKTTNNLKSIDEYNLETLKTMAKKYNIPLSVKMNGGKWKTLNKTEIYSEISKLINKNI